MFQSQTLERTAQTNQNFPIVNPGDVIQPNQTLKEQSQQLAVNICGITGHRIVVPTYFVVDYPNGEKKALHHVRDAQEISDVIRQMRLYEESDAPKIGTHDRPMMHSGLRTMVSAMLIFAMITGAIALEII